MELKDIISIPGKSGLYKLFKPTRNGLIVEALGQSGPKIVVNSSQRVSALKEISIFTTGENDTISLQEVLKLAQKLYQGKAEFDTEDNLTLKTEFERMLPNFDPEKVRLSDMKKFFKWYNLLIEHAIEVFEDQPIDESNQPK
jgi:hypothetical protein